MRTVSGVVTKTDLNRLLTVCFCSLIMLMVAPPTPVRPDTGAPGVVAADTGSGAGTRLTLDAIYKEDTYRAKRHKGTVWLADGGRYTRFQASPDIDGGRDLVSVDPATGDVVRLIAATDMIPEGAMVPLTVEDYSWTADGKKVLVYTNSHRVWRTNTQGDYWVLDRGTGRLHQIGSDFPPSSLMFAKLSPKGDRVAYVQKTGAKIHDIYVEDLNTGERVKLTQDGSETIINGTFDWVYEEEFGLRDGFRWSPDGQFIAYWQLDASGVPDFTLINNTDGLYPSLKTFRYPKVGETNSAARIGVVPAAGGETRWMDIPGNPRAHYLVYLDWAERPDQLVIQQLNRRQNTNRLMLANIDTGVTTDILTDRDDAWLDPVDDFRWFDGGASFLWVSEKSGWRSLYLVSRDGQSERRLTGDYDVIRLLRTDTASRYAYFTASPDDPQRQYLYRIALDGSGSAERLTPDTQAGFHQYRVSADGAYAFHNWSARGRVPVYDLVRLPDHQTVGVFEDNAALAEHYDRLVKGKLEFFTAPGADGTPLQGLMHFPPDFDAQKRYPLLIYVYGEPAAMVAADRWDRQRGLWHLMMAQRGYVVAMLDSRGQPAPKGRAWRKSIYRTLGLTNVDDQAAAVLALLDARPYLDAARVGIWGHSGGGTSTLHALFRHGDIFKAGVSRAPLPDIRLYDSIYQERYSGILPDDAGYYDKAVALNYAHQLQGQLLLVHGTGDDNVHYQGSERLINALVKHRKQFQFFSYPNRTHGLREGAMTTLHLMQMQTDFFDRHIGGGPRP